jgi:lysyl-tRNA synthetase class 2
MHLPYQERNSMLDKVQADRLHKLEEIRKLGIDPYGCRYDTAEAIKVITEKYIKWETAKGGAEAVKAAAADKANPLQRESGDAAGRLVLIRDMGKMIFAHLRDQSGDIQIALRKNALDEKAWSLAQLLDLGDQIAVAGPMERTRTNEITIWAGKLTFLCKALLPMPEKFHGLQDTEIRYRQRYLDLMTNPESMAIFQKRVAILENFREVLKRRGFVEVETPTLQPIYGGAAARPFTTHHNTLDCDLFLRISPELYLKRLLVGGMERVYEFSRVFRNEGIDTRHNPEFTLMELYQAYGDYEVMMEITEELITDAAMRIEDLDEVDTLEAKVLSTVDESRKTREWVDRIPGSVKTPELAAHLEASKQVMADKVSELADSVKTQLEAVKLSLQGKLALPYGDRIVDLTSPWPRKTYGELIQEHAGVSMRDMPAVRAKARELHIEEANKDDAVVINEVFEAVVEPALAKPDANGVIRPVFVKDYPAELCPLTRRKADDPTIALRFELYIAGMEIANAYTELNDPAVQEANLRGQLRGEKAGETMRVLDEDFLTSLRHGMPPAGGLGIGIDRVVMLLTNSTSIRDVVLFPLLRPEKETM